MWTKVTTEAQLASLEQGATIVMYPIKGVAQESFNEAEPGNASFRFVSFNDVEHAILTLSFPQSKLKTNVILGVDPNVYPPVDKTYVEIIAEGLWWLSDVDVIV